MSANVEILIVEDALFFRSIIKNQIEKQLGFSVTAAATYKEAVEILEERGDDFFLALLDLNLPDAPNGEIVEYVATKHVPALVFSGNFDEELREQLLQKSVIDYVVKDSPASIEYVISSVKRIYNNQFIKVLVVDDSQTARYQMAGLLSRYMFQVIEAKDGIEALKLLDQNPDIMMVILDYNMPNLDGFQLTKKIRTHHAKNDICIIGVSTFGNNTLSAKFIKVGANDFITKPFLNEEFFCRISQNIEMLEHIKALKNSLVSDYLTGLSNRKYLFEEGSHLFDQSIAEGQLLVAAMVDLDNFKAVNDTYGHDIGDEALKQVATMLRHHFEDKGFVSRYESEQFSILMLADPSMDIEEIFQSIREKISLNKMTFGSLEIGVTASFGVSWRKASNLEDLLDSAMACLQEAKAKGRNCVVLDEF